MFFLTPWLEQYIFVYEQNNSSVVLLATLYAVSNSYNYKIINIILTILKFVRISAIQDNLIVEVCIQEKKRQVNTIMKKVTDF